MKFTTILLDADIYLHRACAISATKVTFGDETTWTMNARTAGGWLRREFDKIRERLGTRNLQLALGDRQANFRKDLDPSYKAHRAAYLRPPGFTELEANLVAHAKTHRAPRLEGDDILGLLATKEPTDGKVIVTIDKDLKQIPGWHYNPDTDELVEVTPDEGRYFHLLQTLTGDATDGYPGCPGIGPVRARRILAAFEEPEEVWPGIVEAFEKTVPQTDDDAGTPALWQRAERAALLQARLAFVLRQGYYNRKTQEIQLWQP